MGADQKPELILASASPRRLDLLLQVGLVADRVTPAEIDETPLPRERPADAAERLARAKLAEVSARYQGSFVLAADTIVAVGRRILGKPADRKEAAAHLRLLSGRRHRVITAVALAAPGGGRFLRRVETAVSFRRIGEADIAWYLESDEWRGKAGSYAVQGRAAAFVRSIQGSYTNVVGLPAAEVRGLLEGAGYPVRGCG